MSDSHYMYFNSCPILDPLVTQWTTIRDEFLAQVKKEMGEKKLTDADTPGTKANYVTDSFKEQLYQGNFKAMPIFLRDILIDIHEAKDMGWDKWRKRGGDKVKFYEDRIAGLPTIEKWMMDNIDILGSVTFNIALPGSKLNHHWGLEPDYLRFHLVLKSAPGCVFDIENERHEWVDGELFGFDDCNVLHGTKHTGDDFRVIMLTDILKSAVQPYAKHWSCREFIPREQRHVPKIKDW